MCPMQELNPEQLKAVHHIEGPMLVIAGAGSGKTRVVTHRIAHLLSIGILPTDILAVTFTNKAANEMKERVKKLTKAEVLCSTFHSLGAKILRESIQALGYKRDFTIYDEEDCAKLIKQAFAAFGIKDEKSLVRTIKNLISSTKNDLIEEKKAESYEEKVFEKVYPYYQQKLKEYNAVDFDDLLFLPIKIFQENKIIKEEYQNRYLFLLIDEYQDTNVAQNIFIRMLAERHKNIFAVGDPDQSIYSWRGAKYQNILNFEQDFKGAKIISLEQNYRSTNLILSAANSLIEKNPNRKEKNLWSKLGEGEKIQLYIAETEKMEALFIIDHLKKHHKIEHVPLEEMVIFYRTNAQSRIFEDILISEKIPYMIYGGISFYQRKEIKDLIAYLRMIIYESDFISFARTINIPKRGIGPATIEKLQLLCEKLKLPIMNILKAIIENPENYIDLKLSTKQRDSLLSYLTLIYSMREANVKICSISELINILIEKSDFLNYLKDEMDSFDERKENINEFIAKALDYEENKQKTLATFLEEIALVSNIEEKDKFKTVKLMTLHNGKGLEFSHVFIAGLEEDILPHINSKDSIEDLEEERRLLYVGMTRAKKMLYLTSAIYRYMFGNLKIMLPSRFIKDIPTKYLQNLSQISFEKKPQIEVEEDFFSFQEGDRVIHKTFGVGTIKKIYKSSLGETLDIHFDASSSTKSLVAKFAKLQRFSD